MQYLQPAAASGSGATLFLLYIACKQIMIVSGTFLAFSRRFDVLIYAVSANYKKGLGQKLKNKKQK